MLFHYGNCKTDIQDLKQRNVDLMNQVQELKALYDYQVGILEKENAELKDENSFRRQHMIDSLKQEAEVHATIIHLQDERDELNKQNALLKAELGANRCLRESQELESANLQLIVSRKEADISELMSTAIRLKGEVYGLKQEYRAVQNNEPVAIAERVPHTGEIVHRQYTDGEVSTTVDLTRPNSETTIMMGKPLKDAAYYKLLKEIEEKYDIPQEKKPHRKQKKK